MQLTSNSLEAAVLFLLICFFEEKTEAADFQLTESGGALPFNLFFRRKKGSC